ncbi:uncharacterized protein [Rhodnius prolixus]|uniref:Uncharacterized protein n=1 Tax=Rhodnius prolixus TaxID=13249 RepID=T1HSA5_RHOPR
MADDAFFWDTGNANREFKGKVEFSGILPACHPDRVCHNESLRKKGLLRDIRTVLKKLEQLPECDQWDPFYDSDKQVRPQNNMKGPHRFGVYWPRGKPWHCNRVKSSELIAGKMIKFCACCKKNGLQDDCHRTQCQGKPWCMYEPLPKCPPFTQIPGRYVPPDPLEDCPEKPWLKSPEYDAYQRMIKRSENRQPEGCVPDDVKHPQCLCN